MYYVDARIGEVVKDLDTSTLAPEQYYRYRKGTVEDVIIETWSVGGGKALDFATATDNPYKTEERELHFKRHNATRGHLTSYTVPPSWYDEKIEGVKDEL